MGCGTLLVTVNQYEDGRCEVFANLGKAGGWPPKTSSGAFGIVSNRPGAVAGQAHHDDAGCEGLRTGGFVETGG